jgi:hypothetical protein
MIRFTICLALASLGPAHADELSRFGGKYVGCAVSAGEWVPIVTTLTVTGETVSGVYVFIEAPGRWVPGKLAFTIREDDNRLAFSWSDVYGTGSASFAFSRDGARFDGFWTGTNGPDRYFWNGVRQGSGLAPPDCSAPVS